MLLYVFMVWPIKFCKYFEFCAKLICCLKICGECKKFCFGEFRLKILVFENHIISYSCIIVLKFQCFELILNVFFKKLCFSLKFGEPLTISIDPFCFSINRKFLKMFERVSVYFDRSKLTFDRSNLFQIV